MNRALFSFADAYDFNRPLSHSHSHNVKHQLIFFLVRGNTSSSALPAPRIRALVYTHTLFFVFLARNANTMDHRHPRNQPQNQKKSFSIDLPWYESFSFLDP